jgi:hypothetical protein
LSFCLFAVLANALWVHLNQLNQSLSQTLLHLSKLYEQDKENYESAVKYLSSLQPVQVKKILTPLAFFPASCLLMNTKVGCEPLATPF